MNPETLFDAVRLWKKSDPDLAKKIRLLFIGRVGPDVLDLFRDPEIASMIRHVPHLSHKECLRHILGAAVLLLLIPRYRNNRLIMTNKVFEYMRSGNPIVCLDEGSLAADLIRRTRTGFTVRYDDVEGIFQMLRRLYQRREDRRSQLWGPVRRDEVNRYDRRKTVGELAELFDECMDF